MLYSFEDEGNFTWEIAGVVGDVRGVGLDKEAPQVAAALDSVARSLVAPSAATSRRQAIEENLSLAGALWRMRGGRCAARLSMAKKWRQYRRRDGVQLHDCGGNGVRQWRAIQVCGLEPLRQRHQ